MPAAAPPKRRYKSEEFLHIFTTVEFHQRTREQVMGPSFLGLDGKQMKTRTFFTNTNCDTSGNLVYNNWIFNSGEITKIQSAKFFSKERKKFKKILLSKNPVKAGPCKSYLKETIIYVKQEKRKEKLAKRLQVIFFFYFHICFFRDLWRQKLHVQCASTSFYIEKNGRSLGNVFINDI